MELRALRVWSAMGECTIYSYFWAGDQPPRYQIYTLVSFYLLVFACPLPDFVPRREGGIGDILPYIFRRFHHIDTEFRS